MKARGGPLPFVQRLPGPLLRAAACALSLAALPPCADAATRTLTVDAPSPFKALLEKNLDLERAARLPDADSLDDSEWARLIAAAPAQGRALAQTEGYFRAEVTAAPAADDPKQIAIKLVPGEPATVGRFTLEFDGELARKAEGGDASAQALEDRIRAGWKLPPGDVFRNADWDGAKSQVLSTLRNEGYAATVWTATAAQVDPATNKARLFLVADTGPAFLAGNLIIEGLERQDEKSVRLLAGFGAGAPLTQQRLLDYQDRLQKTGLFDQVAVIYDPDPTQAAHATVTVHVHEQSLQQAQVALGFSSNTGPRITFEHTDRKVFGFPATATNKFQWGRELKEWDGQVATHPAENFQSWFVGGSLSDTKSTGDSSTVRAGFIRFGRQQESNPLDRKTFLQFERSIQCVTPGQADELPSPPRQADCLDGRAFSINQQNIWRHLDSVLLPTQGWSLSAQLGLGVAGGPRSTDDPSMSVERSGYGPYARLYGRATGYWPLGHEWYTTTRLELGQIIVKPGIQMPDQEQWRAGGEDSVRGYAWRSLAPVTLLGGQQEVIGGNALVTTSAEIAHPFTASLPSVWWATFVDAGQAAPRFNDLRVAVGYGAGVRWRSPVGPLRVDWSWGDNGPIGARDPGHAFVHNGRIDLSIGITF